MQNLGRKSDIDERIGAEIRRCFIFEENDRRKCAGASGRKLRSVCIYCPNYKERTEEKWKREP